MNLIDKLKVIADITEGKTLSTYRGGVSILEHNSWYTTIWRTASRENKDKTVASIKEIMDEAINRLDDQEIRQYTYAALEGMDRLKKTYNDYIDIVMRLDRLIIFYRNILESNLLGEIYDPQSIELSEDDTLSNSTTMGMIEILNEEEDINQEQTIGKDVKDVEEKEIVKNVEEKEIVKGVEQKEIVKHVEEKEVVKDVNVEQKVFEVLWAELGCEVSIEKEVVGKEVKRKPIKKEVKRKNKKEVVEEEIVEDVNKKELGSDFLNNVMLGNYDMVETYLYSGNDANYVTLDGRNAIHIVCSKKHFSLRMLKLLYSFHIDANAIDNHGYDARYYAESTFCTEALLFLNQNIRKKKLVTRA